MKNLLSKIILTTSVLIFLDQFSKYIIRESGGFYICNANLAFGIKPSYFLLFIFLLIFILFLLKIGNNKSQITKSKQIQNSNYQNSKKWFRNLNFEICNLFDICPPAGGLRFGILLILSGGISNIIDRIYFGCVIDFIDLKFWPVFNLADVFIVIGAIFLILNSFSKKQTNF
jgi:hypothetical protein